MKEPRWVPRVVVDATHVDQRIAFLTAMIFLGLNGKDLNATESEVVQVMVALAEGSLDEAQLIEWMRPRIVRLAL